MDERGKKKMRMNSENWDSKSCLSAWIFKDYYRWMKEGRRKWEWIAKIVILSHAFLLDPVAVKENELDPLFWLRLAQLIGQILPLLSLYIYKYICITIWYQDSLVLNIFHVEMCVNIDRKKHMTTKNKITEYYFLMCN